MSNKTLTIQTPSEYELSEKYKFCLEDIKRYLEIKDYTHEQRFALIKYSVDIALDDNIIIKKFKDIEIKNAGETVKIDLGFWDKNGEYKEDIQIFDII